MKKLLICLGVFVVSSCGVGTSINDSTDVLNTVSIIDVSRDNISSNYESGISSTSSFTSNPYTSVNSVNFYNNYQRATSPSDALYRSQCGLMSGDITPQGHLPSRNINAPSNYGQYYRASNADYTFDLNGEYESFTINTLDKKARKTIYYGGAYTSLEEVAAYLLAFGEVPPNSNYDKSYGKTQSINTWGKYGRVNFDYFSNDTDRYPYEPSLASVNTYNYVETDFGTVGGYYNGTYYQTIYNDGYYINRGAARLVFTTTYTNGAKISDINNRHVFYTYNHYNDFQEYLNYEGGWGERFGFETAGNPYCYNTTAYYEMISPMSPTDYPETIQFTI